MKNQGSPASNEGGQAVLEYILLLAIVLGGLALFLKQVSSSFDLMTATNGAKIEVQMRTGSAPASLWTK